MGFGPTLTNSPFKHSWKINRRLIRTLKPGKVFKVEGSGTHGKKSMDGEILDRRSFIAEGSEVAGEVVERKGSIVHELDDDSLEKIEKLRGETPGGFRMDGEYAITELFRHEFCRKDSEN